jgi:hypothetical protein
MKNIFLSRWVAFMVLTVVLMSVGRQTLAQVPLPQFSTQACGDERAGSKIESMPSPWPAQAQLHQFYPTYTGNRQVALKFWIIRSSNATTQPGIITPAQADEITTQLNQQYSGAKITFTFTTTFIDDDLYSYVNDDSGRINVGNPLNNGLRVEEREQLFQLFNTPNAIDIYLTPIFWTSIPGGQRVGDQAVVPGSPHPTRRAVLVSKFGITANATISGTFNAVKSGKAIAHELGHVFGLQHTHGFPGQAQELPDGSNYQNAGDWLLDTPAEDYNNNNGLSGLVNETNCNYSGAPQYTPGRVGGLYNHLSYATLNTRSCVGYFSYDQICVMHWAMETNAYNIGLQGLIRRNITVANKINGLVVPNSNITIITLNTNTSQTYNSGAVAPLVQRGSYQSRTSNERFNPGHPGISISDAYKHNNWDSEFQQFNIAQNFVLDPSSLDRVANFDQVRAATVRPDLIDASSSGSSWDGIVEMKDPWYYNGTTNPNTFLPYSSTSPFNQTSAYNNTGGVFIGQDPQFTPTFYTVRAPQVQTVNGYSGAFYDWQASNATLQNPSNVETPVVFTAPNAVVSARYKGRLLSSLANATSAGNQRRLANAQGATLYNNVFYLVYESAGKIWLTYTTNGGTSWTNEQYLGDGKNPTVAASSNTALIAWNTGTGQLACRQFIYDPLSPSLSPTLPIPYGNRVTPDAKVIIALPPNHQSTLQATLLCEVSVLNNPSQTRLGGVRVSFSGINGTISSSYDILNSPIFSSPNASMDIAAIQEEATFGYKIHLVHTNYGTGAPYPVYYATVNTSGTLTYTPVMQLTDNAFGTWQPKNLTITLDSLNNKHIAWDAYQSTLNTQVLIYRSISANNQSISPSTRLYSQNGGYRKPSINFFNGTVSLVWQTDDGWTAFGSRQLNNSNWYSFGFQRGWSSANTTIRGAKRFVRTRTGSAPYLLASGTITVSGSPGGGGGETPPGEDGQARTLSGGGSDAEVQSQTLGGGVGQVDVPFFPVERTTGVLSNQAESATLALTLADVGLNGISRTGLTYHDLGANLLPDTLALSASNVFSLLKSRQFTLADTVNQMTATVKVHSKALYDLTQNNPVQLSVELFNVATGNSLALSQTALVTASDTAKDFHFTMNLPNGLNGTDVELRVKVLGFAIQASTKPVR